MKTQKYLSSQKEEQTGFSNVLNHTFQCDLNPFLCILKDANIKDERTHHYGCARAQCFGCSSSFCHKHSLSNRIIF